MKNRTARSLMAMFATLCLMVSSLSAGAIDAPSSIQPHWTGTSSLTVSLSISANGRASCYGDITLRNGYTADVTMTLQRSTNQLIWSDVKTWSASGSGTVELDKDYYVTSGYYYRVHLTADVENARGQLIESPSDNSPIREY